MEENKDELIDTGSTFCGLPVKATRRSIDQMNEFFGPPADLSNFGIIISRGLLLTQNEKNPCSFELAIKRVGLQLAGDNRSIIDRYCS